jgi:hypothetical protein
MREQQKFMGTLTTSRPLTREEINEYNKVGSESIDMYLGFVDDSMNQLEGPRDTKQDDYVDVKQGFLETFHWLKSKDITLTGRITYACEDIFTDEIGGGFGAFEVFPWCVTHYKLDAHGLKIVSEVIN